MGARPFCARAARRRVCTRPRSRARGGVPSLSPTPPGPFRTLASVCQGGQRVGAVRFLCPRLQKGRAVARRRALSGGKWGLAQAGGTVGARCTSSTPLGGEGGRHGNARGAKRARVGPGGFGIPFSHPGGVRRRDGACKRGQEGGVEGVLKEA